jgi:hypothetical protein
LPDSRALLPKAIDLPPRILRLVDIAPRRDQFGLAALALLFAIQISPWLYPSEDGCLYLRTVSNFLSTERLDDFRCLVPPGYPLLIAPAFLFGERPFLAVSILSWLLAVATIGGVYVWARRLMPSAALLLTAAVAVNISLWTFYRRPSKELATLAFLLGTVNVMHRLLDERRLARTVALTLGVALLTAFLVLIRYAAITLVLAFAAAAVLTARQGGVRLTRALAMSAVIGVVSASALVGWLAYDAWHGTGGTYLNSMIAVYRGSAAGESSVDAAAGDENIEAGPRRQRHFVRAALYRLNDLACLTIPGLWTGRSSAAEQLGLSTALGGVLLAFAAVGWWRIFSARVDVLALLFPIYLLVYAHWDCAQPGGRFLLPMLPILLACVGLGLWHLVRMAAPVLQPRWQAAFVTAFLGAHLAQAAGYWLLRDAPQARECSQNLPVVDRLAGRIRQRAGLVAVAASLEQSGNGLWLDLDWKRLRILDERSPARSIWIVDQAGAAPREGFAVVCVDGPFQLSRRRPSEQPATEDVAQQIRPRGAERR